ncbi:Uncharacterised protein [Acinetobacter pittii]|nr:Uncharacterised protein [Acinetobacter pittii]
MLKMPVHLTRGLLVSSLSIALTACINMQASQLFLIKKIRLLKQ